MIANYLLRHPPLATTGVIVISAICLLSSPTLAAPPPVIAQQTVTGVATVESIDQSTRQVLLSDSSGNLLTIVAGPAVRNLAQVHAGDQVQLTYEQAIAVQIAPPGSNLPSPTGEAAASRAARGQLPAGVASMLVHVTVRVDAIDKARHTVTFTEPNGVTRTVLLRSPAMQNFANKLRPGDNLHIDYLQVVAMSVQKMKP